MKIHILTPVHVGSGHLLGAEDYVRVKRPPPEEGFGLRRLDLAKLVSLQCAGQPARAREVAGQFETTGGLHRFLAQTPADHARQCLSYRVACSSTMQPYYDPGLQETLLDLEIHECCKSGQRPVLPGSSLKGALLTAHFFAAYESFAEAERALARGRNPENHPGGLSPRLRVGDTLGSAELALYNCRRVMHVTPGDHDSPLKALQVGAECLALNQELSGRLVVRPEAPRGRGGLRREELVALCAAANDFSRRIAADDRAHLQRYLVPTASCEAVIANLEKLRDPLACYVRVGWGVGRAATSLGLLQGEDYRPAKTHWLVSKPVSNGQATDFGGTAVPLGWVRVSFEETDYLP